MNEVAVEKKSIRAFCEHLTKGEIPLSPENMADEFLSFFSSQHPPTSHYWIESFCSEIGVDEVQYSSFPENMRGFHSISSDGRIIIVLEQSSHAGRIHTLYHEIYEIVCEIVNAPDLKTEYKANLFAASVIMPDQYFFEYAVRRSLMFNEMKIYYSEIATESILLRINHLFRKRGEFHIAYCLKNNNAYKNYRGASHEDRKNLADFQLSLSTLDALDSANNEKFTRGIINESLQRIMQLSAEELSLIKFSRPNKIIVLAEPILLDWNGAIKEIAIQLLQDEVYDNLGDLLKEEK